MIVFSEFAGLHREYAAGRQPDWDLLSKHDLLSNKAGRPWRERVYRAWRNGLAALNLDAPYVSKYEWSARLRHVDAPEHAVTVVLWGMDLAKDALRQACDDMNNSGRLPDAVLPVLVTNVADFAFYSRLGWQVEYLPALRGESDPYQLRKAAYLAWRYRDAALLSLAH